jgi:hypothetical protein
MGEVGEGWQLCRAAVAAGHQAMMAAEEAGSYAGLLWRRVIRR